MSTAVPTWTESSPPHEAICPESSYLSASHGLKSWFLTVDHKRIAVLYLISVSVFFLIGGLLATAIRLELLTPQTDLMSPDT